MRLASSSTALYLCLERVSYFQPAMGNCFVLTCVGVALPRSSRDMPYARMWLDARPRPALRMEGP